MNECEIGNNAEFDEFTTEKLSPVIRRLVTAEDIEASQQLRFKVWKAEGVRLNQCPDERIADDYDFNAVHWGAFLEDILVASSRLSVHNEIDKAPDGFLFAGLRLPTPAASLNRLVTHKLFRAQGIANEMDRLRIEYARQCGCAVILASPVASPNRIKHFESLAFSFPGIDGMATWGNMRIVAAYLLLK